MRRKQLELAILGIVIIGIIVYAGTSIVYSGALVASSERTLNTVISHQNTLNTSFNEIDQEISALNGSGTFNPQQAITLADKSIANSQLATLTINQDDSSLTSVQGQLQGSRWLTAVGRSSIDKESTRVVHARNALAAARTIATDQVLDGRFWHSLYTALADLDQLNTQTTSGDLTSAKSTLASMQAAVDQAVQQSTSPGLPIELHNLMVDLKTFTADFGKQLDAQVAGDDASAASYQATLDADRTKIAAYNIDKIGTQIDMFYKPLIDRFNSEIAAATS